LLALVVLGGLAAIIACAVSWADRRVVEPRHASFTLPPDPAHLVNGLCGGCHRAGRARVDLVGPYDARYLRRDRDVWENVVRKIRSREMPPADSPQLDDQDRALVIDWIEKALADSGAERFAVRRLTRAEYANTLSDLLGVGFDPADDFPADELPGWDLVRELPPLPADMLAGYRAAADKALDAKIVETALAEHLPAQPSTECESVDDGIRSALTTLAGRAFRRPLSDDETEQVLAVFDQAQEDGRDQVESVRVALQGVLTSPQFLYHIEAHDAAADDDSSEELGQFALAARLSFFLWKSIPDQELWDHAERGDLSQNLAQQTRRMLQDPRAEALVRGLADHWLGLGRLEARGGADPALQATMRRETELFLANIVREDRSVLEVVAADYTFVNETLAKNYGMADVRGGDFRRVSLAGSQRGGVISQGSILMLTSHGIASSPVQRGKWIMDTLLDTPPPAPPAGLVEAFKDVPKVFEPSTARQALEKHRTNASCAHCHGHIDAYGLALENFSSLGAWRTHELGRFIDATVALPSGETIAGPAGLRTHLLAQKDLLVRGLAKHLLRQALQRKLTDDDQQELEGVAARVADAEYRFGAVIAEVVASEAFRR
jgi:mono/diheme cytochrome c family protein